MAGAVRLATPPRRSFAKLTGVQKSAFRLWSNHSFVSSHQQPRMPQKNRPNGGFVLAGAVRLATPPRRSFAKLTGVQKSAFRLWSNHSFVSSHQQPRMPQKNRPNGGFVLAGAVRFELTTLGFGDRCSTN